MTVTNGVRRLWIIWAAVVTVCTCATVPCYQECFLPEAKDHECKDLDAYLKCMKSLKCRGNIGYHSAITVSNAEYRNKKCNTSEHSHNSNNQPVCQLLFDDKKEHKFCGLFGDPHLRTFDGKYQTCRIHGAWQVIENPFFSIMVTNDVVSNSATATAPTKLTVLLKAHKPECTPYKLFEAQGDAQLPSKFDDGTTFSGPDSLPTVSLSWRRNDQNSETVILRLSYISTIITITRVGKYISVSAKLPEQLAQTFNQEKNELCSTGCPASEQIDIKQVQLSELDRILTLCRTSVGPTGHRLTDQYLDWCVFDMMTSQDEHFINASHAAYSDVLFFEPRSLFNRTLSVFEYNPPSIADTGCKNKFNLFILVAIILHNIF